MKQSRLQLSQANTGAFCWPQTPPTENISNKKKLGISQIRDMSSYSKKKDFVSSVRENFRDTLKTSG